LKKRDEIELQEFDLNGPVRDALQILRPEALKRGVACRVFSMAKSRQRFKPQVSATTCGSPWALSGAAWVAAQDLPWTPGAGQPVRAGLPSMLEEGDGRESSASSMIWSGNPLAGALPPIAIVGRTSQVGSFVPAPDSCIAASRIFIRSHVAAGPSVRTPSHRHPRDG
jgi:hypothetical protein